MTEEELALGANHAKVNLRAGSGIAAYDSLNGAWSCTGYLGSFASITYSVPIDWKDPLLMLKKKVRKPCGPEHFPPGTFVRSKFKAEFWAMLLGVGPSGIDVVWDTVEIQRHCFTKLLGIWERSLDGGKTWLPCYVEVEE